jgi:hypothetical protein
MTKLEQKLCELGYFFYKRAVYGTSKEYCKKVDCFRIFILLNDNNDSILDSYVWQYDETDDYMNNKIQAFNILQNDLKELKEDE